MVQYKRTTCGNRVGQVTSGEQEREMRNMSLTKDRETT